MIRLTAMQLDVYGHLRFTNRHRRRRSRQTDHSLAAAKALADLGVERPLQRVEHVRTWGVVEIDVPVSDG